MDFQLCNMETLLAHIFRQMFQEVDDFAFAGSRATGEDDDVKSCFHDTVGVGPPSGT